MRSHPRFVLCGGLFLLAVVFAVLPWTRSAAGDAEAPTTRSFHQAAQAEVESAEKVVAYVNERERANEALTPEFVEWRSLWNKRLRDARIVAAETPSEKRKAAEGYLATCRGWLPVQQNRTHHNPATIARAQYDIAEAELCLASLYPR
jgi:hypothetical protein